MASTTLHTVRGAAERLAFAAEKFVVVAFVVVLLVAVRAVMLATDAVSELKSPVVKVPIETKRLVDVAFVVIEFVDDAAPNEIEPAVKLPTDVEITGDRAARKRQIICRHNVGGNFRSGETGHAVDGDVVERGARELVILFDAAISLVKPPVPMTELGALSFW